MPPNEVRALPRSERAFMYAALLWKNEEEAEANKRAASKRFRTRRR